jgi:hypothetical protein
MALSLASASFGLVGSVPAVQPRAVVKMETAADMEGLAKKLNPGARTHRSWSQRLESPSPRKASAESCLSMIFGLASLRAVVGYWDPMNLVAYDQFSVGEEASIGFLRQAEIKHGRVASAHALRARWPSHANFSLGWLARSSHAPSIERRVGRIASPCSGGVRRLHRAVERHLLPVEAHRRRRVRRHCGGGRPAGPVGCAADACQGADPPLHRCAARQRRERRAAVRAPCALHSCASLPCASLPCAARRFGARLLTTRCDLDGCTTGFLEICGESTYILEQSGMKHYMKGGKPGVYPSLKTVMPHPVPLDLFDPFGLQSKMSPEKKEKALLAEINNGACDCGTRAPAASSPPRAPAAPRSHTHAWTRRRARWRA